MNTNDFTIGYAGYWLVFNLAKSSSSDFRRSR
jgi:hypothetical protein